MNFEKKGGSTKIMKIHKLWYRAIIKYLYVTGFHVNIDAADDTISSNH